MSKNRYEYACCLFSLARLSVLMEDDVEVLEFRASAGDLLRGSSEREVRIWCSNTNNSVPNVPHPHSMSSVDAAAWLRCQTNFPVDKQHWNHVALPARDPASVFGAQALASSSDRQLQQPFHWWWAVSGAAAKRPHAGEMHKYAFKLKVRGDGGGVLSK